MMEGGLCVCICVYVCVCLCVAQVSTVMEIPQVVGTAGEKSVRVFVCMDMLFHS